MIPLKDDKYHIEYSPSAIPVSSERKFCGVYYQKVKMNVSDSEPNLQRHKCGRKMVGSCLFSYLLLHICSCWK